MEHTLRIPEVGVSKVSSLIFQLQPPRCDFVNHHYGRKLRIFPIKKKG